ncbi:MAG: hypothetical protein RJQ09_07195 [Cyclobacteriaceae bacterium]
MAKNVLLKSTCLLILISIFVCCETKQSENGGNALNQLETDSIHTNRSDLKMTVDFDSLLNAATKSHNSDTALAYFHYTNHDNYSIEHEIQFQRLDLEYDKQIELFESLFKQDTLFDEKLRNINLNLKRYIENARNEVTNDYLEFNALTGRTFRFLSKRKDSVVLSLVNDIIENDSASFYEKEFGVNEVITYFGDSSFYKKLERLK